MQESLPSRTALRVALRRAAHQIYDAKPLILNDPFAVPLLGPAHRAELERTPQRPGRTHSKSLRAWVVARSRFAEDELAASILTGATQYVVLGAGLDTFALRNPHPGLQVFEVDHPATQAWKRELLAAAGMTLPANAHLVPVDFERNHLATALLASGFNSQAKTIFAWLGVVPYLSSAAFRATLSFIATFPEGSGVIFDYGQPRAALPPLEQLAHDSLASRVQLAGEPFQLFFTPSGMTTELTAFRLITDLGSPGLNARFFTARSDTLRLVGSAGRLVSARL